MERYFLLIIVVTLVGVIAQKKIGQEANLGTTPLEERRAIAAITTYEKNPDYTDILTPYTKFKTSAAVVNDEKIYEATANKNSTQKTAKSWRRQVNKMPGSANPRTLFNILRSLPMGEPYFIE